MESLRSPLPHQKSILPKTKITTTSLLTTLHNTKVHETALAGKEGHSPYSVLLQFVLQLLTL